MLSDSDLQPISVSTSPDEETRRFIASELERRAQVEVLPPLADRLIELQSLLSLDGFSHSDSSSRRDALNASFAAPSRRDALNASPNEERHIQCVSTGFKGQLLVNEPMARHTSIKIWGPADLWCVPSDLDSLSLLLREAERLKIPFHFHGAGSNTLVKDGGIRGVVISLESFESEIRIVEESPTYMTLEAGASTSLHALVRFAGKHGLLGMSCLAGIPASVGGALFMNAGVPKGTITDTLTVLLVLGSTGKIRSIPKEKLRLSYRKNDLPSGSVILGGRFCLERGDVESVQRDIAEVLERRKEKQPLHLPNMGSVFMNPSEDEVRASRGKTKTASKERLTRLPTAGELIDEAGLKTVRVGGARVSEKHANFIVNEGGASAEDVQILMRLVRDKVKELFGIVLKPEVKIIGEDVEQK